MQSLQNCVFYQQQKYFCQQQITIAKVVLISLRFRFEFSGAPLVFNTAYDIKLGRLLAQFFAPKQILEDGMLRILRSHGQSDSFLSIDELKKTRKIATSAKISIHSKQYTLTS